MADDAAVRWTVNRCIRRILGSAALLLTLATPVRAQVTTSGIQGSVKDSSGAVLPGVAVEVRNVDTNLSRSLTTDAGGRFFALQLPPGRYSVTLKLAGFKTVVHDNVLLTVGETSSISPTMDVSGVAETVTVNTASPAIEPSRTAGVEHDRRHGRSDRCRSSGASSKTC